MKYVFWDWNGTLLDDFDASIGAFNDELLLWGVRPVTPEFYRENFAFPVRGFYERAGLDLSRVDWDALARRYHDNYLVRPTRLNPETVAALELVRSAGGGQSIVSALRDDYLQEAVGRAGVVNYMEFVRGSDNLNGASKLDRTRELLAEVRALHPDAEITMIGDAVHDAEVACELGLGCVLCGCGGHSLRRLKAIAPAYESLLEATRAALR